MSVRQFTQESRMKPYKFLYRLTLASSLSVLAPQLSAEPLAFDLDMPSEGAYKLGVFYDNVNQATFNFGLEQPNLLGTDDNLVLDLSYSKYSSGLSVRSTDPDLFESPWSRTFSFSARQISTHEDVLRDFSFGTADAEVSFGREFGPRRSMSIALGYNLLDLKNSDDLPVLIANADVLDDGQVHTGYATLSHKFSTMVGDENFATSGSTFITSLEIGNAGSTPYAVGQLSAQRIIPLGERMFTKGRIAASAGFTNSGDFPFNQNTSVGGPGSVRGYKPNSLGPVSAMQTSGENAVVGGKYALTYSLEVGMISGQNRNLAMFAFMDGGDATNDTSDLAPSRLNRTTGVGLRWQSPVGPFDISYAQPVHDRDDERTQELQFTFGWLF